MSTAAVIRQTPILQALPLVALETDAAVLQQVFLSDHRRRVRDAAVVRAFTVLETGPSGSVTLDAGLAETITVLSGSGTTITNAPDAITEISANRRIPVDLTGRTEIAAGVAGTAVGGGFCVIRVSTDAGASFHAFATECRVADTGIGAAVGTLLGTFVAIDPADAIATAIISVFTDGDATPTEDPVYTTVIAVVR